jgi:hypothetical protein
MLSNIYTATLDGDEVTYLQADCADFETAAITLNGTWDGEIVFYATIGDVTYPGTAVKDSQTDTLIITFNPEGAAVNSLYFGSVRGLTGFGVATQTWTSGTVAVQISLHRASK